MLTKNKITEIFCICDYFCKGFDKEVAINVINTKKYRGCGNRITAITESEVMTILIIIHSDSFRNFKHFYELYIRDKVRHLFPDAPSYSRFVTLMQMVGIKPAFFLKMYLTD